MIRLLAALNNAKQTGTCGLRTPDLGHPGVGHHEMEAAFCSLCQIPTGLSLCLDLFNELDGSTQALCSQRCQVARNHAPYPHFQVYVTEFVCHGKCLLGGGTSFFLLTHISRKQHGKISQSLHEHCTRLVLQQSNDPFKGCTCLVSS